MNTDSLERIALDYPFTVVQLHAAADDLTELELRKLCWYACRANFSPAGLRAEVADGDIHAILANCDYTYGALHDALGDLRRTILATRGGRVVMWLLDRLNEGIERAQAWMR